MSLRPAEGTYRNLVSKQTKNFEKLNKTKKITALPTFPVTGHKHQKDILGQVSLITLIEKNLKIRHVLEWWYMPLISVLEGGGQTDL